MLAFADATRDAAIGFLVPLRRPRRQHPQWPSAMLARQK